MSRDEMKFPRRSGTKQHTPMPDQSAPPAHTPDRIFAIRENSAQPEAVCVCSMLSAD